MKDHEVTPGQLLYIYMVNKMSDGRMKLRKMGIDEDDVQKIVASLDPRFVQIADNPKAELCAFKGMTLRIECKLVEDNRPETQKALIEKMPVLKPALGENGEKGVMCYLAEATATFFKMMEPVETITF